MTQPSPSVPALCDIDQQALDWFARRERSLSADEAAQFNAWLAANPAHGEAYARWHGDWARLDALPAADIDRLRRQLALDKASAAAAPSPARRHWLATLAPRAALATLALSASGGGILAWQHWQQQPLYAASFATARGQQQSVTLPDGSVLRLDTATRVAVTLYRQRREVRLLDGQAMFQVRGDAKRPFDVLAGAVRITVVGTRFSVRHTPGMACKDDVRVEVEEGRVSVARGTAPAGTPAILLTAGQRVGADQHGRLGAIGKVAARGIAPWREGRVSFDDTPLAQVLAEFERYGATGLVVRDAQVAQLGVTGTFDPLRLANFMRVLPRVLPVALRRDGDVTEIAAAR
ncbi:FecR family protein [Janthinobacterium psychrotolerans]|uniref:Transmembrane sensor n=1 Tax=Janthinobacterium psychrotolerans TaxID=1747903 RepID=A0A1A7C1I6_9BURK|nr:FecR domain-containing protein [Janthinobacterium psychrotolerans]OBV38183.1 transmembrane sensor [Janthinobacterium psychrotolerans]